MLELTADQKFELKVDFYQIEDELVLAKTSSSSIEDELVLAKTSSSSIEDELVLDLVEMNF